MDLLTSAGQNAELIIKTGKLLVILMPCEVAVAAEAELQPRPLGPEAADRDVSAPTSAATASLSSPPAGVEGMEA